MVRLTTLRDLERDLVEQLLAESSIESRCPNFRKDNLGCYCGRDLKEGDRIGEQRRLVCGSASLQLWCLDKERYDHCIWYRGEAFQE